MSTAQIKPVSPTSSRNSAFPPHRVAGQSTPGTVSSHMKGLLVPAAALYDHADTREAKHVINQGRGFCHSQELIVKQSEHVHAHSHHPVEKSRPLISTQTVRAERGARSEGRGARSESLRATVHSVCQDLREQEAHLTQWGLNAPSPPKKSLIHHALHSLFGV